MPQTETLRRAALVTGGAKGIGRAICLALAENGVNIAVNYAGSAAAAEETAANCRALGVKAITLQADVRTPEACQKLVEDTVAAFGRIDVLVNNAGVAPKVRADLLEMTEESFDRVVGTNTKGNLFLTQAAAKQMLRQEPIGKKRGTIINISSCSAEVSSVSRGEYCVSKAGVSMLTTLFADRLAGEGILVNEIRPGVIATDMTSTVTGKYDKLIADGAFPIARWGTPEDIANAVSVFAGDDFLYTTGSYLDVDGGFHIKRL